MRVESVGSSNGPLCRELTFPTNLILNQITNKRFENSFFKTKGGRC